MGLFDSTWFPCPTCGDAAEVQSKGEDQPYCNTFDSGSLPGGFSSYFWPSDAEPTKWPVVVEGYCTNAPLTEYMAPLDRKHPCLFAMEPVPPVGGGLYGLRALTEAEWVAVWAEEDRAAARRAEREAEWNALPPEEQERRKKASADMLRAIYEPHVESMIYKDNPLLTLGKG